MIDKSFRTLERIQSQRLNALIGKLSKNDTKQGFFLEWNSLNMQGNTSNTSRYSKIYMTSSSLIDISTEKCEC